MKLHGSHIPEIPEQAAALFQILDRIQDLTGEEPVADFYTAVGLPGVSPGRWTFRTNYLFVRFSAFFIYVGVVAMGSFDEGSFVETIVRNELGPSGSGTGPPETKWTTVDRVIHDGLSRRLREVQEQQTA